MGRRGIPPEFRRKVLALVEAGRSVADVARDLEMSDQSISTWRWQDRIDRGLQPGPDSGEKAELAAAKRRIAELETELHAMRRAMELVREVVPQWRFEAVKVMAAGGIPVQVACRVLDVSVLPQRAEPVAGDRHRPSTPPERQGLLRGRAGCLLPPDPSGTS
jgi:transposase-like protein